MDCLIASRLELVIAKSSRTLSIACPPPIITRKDSRAVESLVPVLIKRNYDDQHFETLPNAADASTPDLNRPHRFEFRAVPHGCSSSRTERGEGGGGRYTIHAGGAQHRGAKGNSNSSATTKKRKRTQSRRRGPANDRAGGGGVPSVSVDNESPASMSSGSRANFQVRTKCVQYVVHAYVCFDELRVIMRVSTPEIIKGHFSLKLEAFPGTAPKAVTVSARRCVEVGESVLQACGSQAPRWDLLGGVRELGFPRAHLSVNVEFDLMLELFRH